MHCYQVVLLLAALGIAVQASPLASMLGLQRVRRAAKIATVDCSNREAVMFVLRTRANFRCVYPEYNKATQYKVSGDSAQFGTNMETSNLVKEERINCGPGYMYSLDFDMCLEVPNQSTNPIPLETGNLVAQNPILEITSNNGGPSSAADCPKGTIFNSEIGVCSDLSDTLPHQPLETGNLHREENVAPIDRTAYFEYNGCTDEQTYVASLDICVDKRGISKRRPRQTKPVSSRQDQGTAFCEHKPPNIPAGDCESHTGCMHQASTGLCIKEESKKSNRRKPLKRVAFRQRNECGTNEMFSPAIGICMPLTTGTGRGLISASLVKEPVVDAIHSFSSDVSPEICKLQGKFFNHEVSLCL